MFQQLLSATLSTLSLQLKVEKLYFPALAKLRTLKICNVFVVYEYEKAAVEGVSDDVC